MFSHESMAFTNPLKNAAVLAVAQVQPNPLVEGTPLEMRVQLVMNPMTTRASVGELLTSGALETKGKVLAE